MGDASILNSTKKALGLAEDYDVFDPEIIMFINGAFATLNDLGLGPSAGFAIDDASLMWSDYLGTDARLNSVKTYMYLRVRLLFDPPQTSYLQDSMTKQIQEHEWRLNVLRENAVSAAAAAAIVDGGGVYSDPLGGNVYDGGTP